MEALDVLVKINLIERILNWALRVILLIILVAAFVYERFNDWKRNRKWEKEHKK